MVAGGTGTASVTVEPFAAIAPGNTTVFVKGVPTGVGRHKAQGIVLALADITNATAAALRSNYFLSTPPNRAGKVKKIGIHRVTYDAASNVVQHIPQDAAQRAQDLPAHHPRSAGRSRDVVLQQGGHHLGNGVIPGTRGPARPSDRPRSSRHPNRRILS